ncbi:MAG: Transcriptional regulator LysR family [Thermoanaerobacterales bacterium 50_218]|nr:MAG: Transcriptional regulator LysR family [Thermoanaerobacterales bacterium 50_218]HAA89592.1 LysR family transcriptional regulator [Peptococcaceae bacterium]
MNFSWLLTFNMVVEKKSLTKAAQALHLTQPAVSKHLRSLEQYYGTTLVHRTTRDIELTEAGKVVYHYSKQVVGLLQKSREEVKNIAGCVKGELLIGASTIPGEYLLPHLLGRFQQLYPEVKVKMEIADSEVIVRKVLANEVEVGFVGVPVTNRALQEELVYEDELVVIVPRNHRFAGRQEITLEELLTEPLLVREKGSGTRRVIEGRLAEQGVDPRSLKVKLELGSTEAVINAVIAGLGISLVSRLAAQLHADSGELACLRLKGLSFKRGLFLITRKHQHKSLILEKFLSFLKSQQHKL